MLIIGWNFHFDPLGSSGILLEICAALSLNLLMTQTVIQEPASPHILVLVVVMMNECQKYRVSKQHL